jgi:hypothetical protein
MNTIIDTWLDALQQRHRSAFTTTEFLKSVRALSARYVERRSSLPGRSPVDSAGKRAAFAAFYAPLHLLTTAAIVRELEVDAPRRIVDLGCGTGVAGAAWALALEPRPPLLAIDSNPWALGEAKWNWRQLGVSGETRRGDLIDACERLLAQRASLASTGVIAGWSVNELTDAGRTQLLPYLLEFARIGAAVLVIEPVSRAATPWWPAWERAFTSAGGRSDPWRFDAELPPVLRTLDEAAGFGREELTAKSLWHSGQP